MGKKHIQSIAVWGCFLLGTAAAFAQDSEPTPQAPPPPPDFRVQVHGFESAQAGKYPVSDKLLGNVGALGFWSVGQKNFVSFCTGTLVHRRFVLTAAHCVAAQKQGTGYLYFFPGKTQEHAETNRYAPIPVEAAWIPAAYDPEAERGTENVDWAVVQLNSDAEFDGLPMAEPRGKEYVWSIGYPGDKSGSTLWATNGFINSDRYIRGWNQSEQFSSHMRVFPGMSGAAVFFFHRSGWDAPIPNMQTPWIGGVVTEYFEATNQSFGVRLTRQVIGHIQEAIALGLTPFAGRRVPEFWRWLDFAQTPDQGRLMVFPTHCEDGELCEPGVLVRKPLDGRAQATLYIIRKKLTAAPREPKDPFDRYETPSQPQIPAPVETWRELQTVQIPGQPGEAQFLHLRWNWWDEKNLIQLEWR